MDEPDVPAGREPAVVTPEDLLGPGPFPRDARRMGFDRYSDEGALIALAASLDPTKPSHRVMAWLLLLVMVTPLVLSLRYVFV